MPDVGMETITFFGTLDRANINHWKLFLSMGTNRASVSALKPKEKGNIFSETLCFIEFEIPNN
jgi:hypothetical protein